MAKTYTEILAEWVKKRDASRPRQDKSLVAFLAVRDDVKAAMAEGYALKTIWQHMNETGKLSYRYETFLKHVRKHIKEKQEKPLPKPQAGKSRQEKSSFPDQPVTGKGENPKVKQAKSQLPGFVFDANPNEKDLI